MELKDKVRLRLMGQTEVVQGNIYIQVVCMVDKLKGQATPPVLAQLEVMSEDETEWYSVPVCAIAPTKKVLTS